jgi:FtsP/CotA-like multicopper oxidase with cupredoxin domain
MMSCKESDSYSNSQAISDLANGNQSFYPDIEINIRATQTDVPIISGNPTRVWKYEGELISGNPLSFQNLEGSYLGPIIKARKGQKVRIRFTNNIPEESIIHWHGLHVPSRMDGHPRDVIGQGNTYTYEFEVKNRAGTYWYHPHPHGRTGPQVNQGLAGFFLVSDDEEEALGLPQEKFDIPLVIQDRTFDRNNQFVYLQSGMMGQMNEMEGFLGNRILVNGNPDFELTVSTRAYRLRLLNGSNSRICKLAWENGEPLVVIGTDGGLLEKPISRQYVMLSPGERIELWADFSVLPVGSEMALVSLPFDAGMMSGGMMRRRMMDRQPTEGESLPNGAAFSVFKVKVMQTDNEHLILPERLSNIDRYSPEHAINFGNPRTFRLSIRYMTWTINGRTFQMEEVANDEVVKLNTLEIWEFINEGGSMGMMGMMQMPHPMHLHGLQFQVLERENVTHNGYVDEGWKDTVLLMPGERVKLLVKFEDFTGLYLYHCHNLEHEDMGMMRNYLVR